MFFESYGLKFLLLFTVFSSIALIDYFVNGKKAKKHKEYLTLLLITALFSLFGVLHDQVTVSISPEYYAIGKGLGTTELRLHTFLFGLQSGSYAGLIFGCVFLYFEKTPGLSSFIRWLMLVFLFAVLGVVLGVFCSIAALGLGGLPSGFEGLSHSFVIVWAWHIGLYFGAVLGLLFCVFRKYPSRLRYVFKCFG